jgi:hypothetical protein
MQSHLFVVGRLGRLLCSHLSGRDASSSRINETELSFHRLMTSTDEADDDLDRISPPMRNMMTE